DIVLTDLSVDTPLINQILLEISLFLTHQTAYKSGKKRISPTFPFPLGKLLNSEKPLTITSELLEQIILNFALYIDVLPSIFESMRAQSKRPLAVSVQDMQNQINLHNTLFYIAHADDIDEAILVQL